MALTPRSRYSRRHYEQFAAIVNDMRTDADADGVFTLCYVVDFTEKLVVTFSRDNPRFNRERFLAACGFPLNIAKVKD